MGLPAIKSAAGYYVNNCHTDRTPLHFFLVCATMHRSNIIVQSRSERNRVDRKNMIQECKNPIVEDDFHGFLHRNCEGTEQF